MGELAQAQVGDGDEVGGGSEAARRAFGLLHHPVHGLNEGVGAVIEHAAHDMATGTTPSCRRVRKVSHIIFARCLIDFGEELASQTVRDRSKHSSHDFRRAVAGQR